MNRLFVEKALNSLRRKVDATLGRLLFNLDKTVEAMALRPFELHLELTNLCNANCVFCPYQFQERNIQYMSDEVFAKAVSDYVEIGGGSVGLTPIVGDALVDPKFLERVRFLRAQDAIDRIFMTTNAILVDRFGAREVIESGLSSITISTASFDKDNYRAIYRNPAYRRMRNNVLALMKENQRSGNPVNIAIGFRTDRALSDVVKDADFQAIKDYGPPLDFTWSYTSAGGRIKRNLLPAGMHLRTVTRRLETCANLLNGPIVLPDGTVVACSCVAAMDATNDLGIGNVLENSLLEIYTSPRMKNLRAEFSPDTSSLNVTCGGCDMYRNLDLYRIREGRIRAELNRRRRRGELVYRPDKPKGTFQGG